jgi:chemotaxis signal transduction protein
MSTGPDLEELRRQFDSAFAAEPAPRVERVDLVVLRVGEASYAVRVSEVAAVAPLGGVARVPCGEPAFLGIAAFRGAPVPVYDLAALLGDGAARAPRWMLLAGGEDRVALAFDELEQYLRAAREQLVAAARPGASAAEPGELLRAGASLRPVVSLASVRMELERRLGLPEKGR